MFRTLEFRQALSHAIDREGLATAAFPGPLTQGWCGGFQSGSPFHNPDLVTCYEYNPEQAVALFNELGFEDTTGDGLLNWPEDSPLAGQSLIIEVFTGEDAQASVEAGQALVPMLREVGIDLRLRVVTGPSLTDRINTGNFDMVIQRIDSPTPDVQMGTFGPAAADEPDWHQAGPDGRELLPFEVRMEELFTELAFATDAGRRTEILHEVLQLHTENVYTLGLYEARAGLAVHNRLRNIPDDLPTFMYEWGMENMPWVAWAPVDEQIAPRFLDDIPTPESYQGRDWQR